MRWGAERDNTYQWLRDLRQPLDFAEVIRAHFDNGVFVLVGELKQRLRYADIVVKISLRRKYRCIGAEDRRDHLLDGGLAIAAGDTDNTGRKAAPPGLRKASQCAP